MSMQPSILALVELGFSPIESRVYIQLLKESPQSGYKVSQALGRPAAQVYRAIESLERSGAVIADEGAQKLSRALPIEDVLRNMERQFESRRKKVLGELKDIKSTPDDHRVYQLKTIDQVYVRAEQMIGRAKKVIVADVFPRPLARLVDTFTRAMKRGVKTAIKEYDTSVLRADVTVKPSDTQKVLDVWPGDHISLVTDCGEFLSALLSKDETKVHNAVWTCNSYLSSLQHNGIICEISYTYLRSMVEEGLSNRGIRANMKRVEPFFLSNVISEKFFGKRLTRSTAGS